jgi:EmrB/QacA subfamily drug resistance transporter
MASVIVHPCDEGIIRSGAAAAPCAEAAGPWVLAATILASSMVFLDGTVVNVALPVMQERLGASAAAVQWIVESYALTLGALLLVGGSLGDQFGRRRVFAVGVAVFSAASLWCGLAPSVEQLIVARGVQGVGGALLVPGSLAIISASFPDEQRGKAIGTWSGFTAITSAIGPLLGGALADRGLWRWIFFINLPLACVVLAILFARVPESRGERRASLDWPGALLAMLGLGGVVYGLIASSGRGWRDPAVAGAVVAGAAALVLFVVVEARSAAPMMPLGLFRSRTFAGANLLTLFLYAALSGALFFVPFVLIQVEGYTATEAGAAMLPFILIMFALSRWSGGLVARFGGRRPLVAGPLVAAAGFALFARPGAEEGSYWTGVFPAVVVLGIGMAISVAPLTTVVMGAVDRRYAGTASGINNAVSRVAALVSIAVMGLVVLGFSTQRDTFEVADRASAEAFVSGFRVVMLLAAALAVAASVCAWALVTDTEPRAVATG